MQERYKSEKVRQGALAYEEILKAFRDKTESGSMPTYAEITSSYYADIYYRKTAKSLVAQGFAFKDE